MGYFYNFNITSIYSVYSRIILTTLISTSLFHTQLYAVGNDTDLKLTTRDKEVSRSCTSSGLYCSPQENDSWAVNDKHVVRWDKYDPSIQTSGKLDLYLYISDNTREPLFTKKELDNKGGDFSVDISRAQFYQFDSNFEKNDVKGPVRKSAWFVIKPSGSQSNDGAKGPNFNIIDPDPPRPSSSSEMSKTASASSSSRSSSNTDLSSDTYFVSPSSNPEQNDNNNENNNNNNNSIPIYGIVLIALAGLIVLVAIPLFFFWRKRTKKPNGVAESTEKNFIMSNKGAGAGARRLGSTSSAGLATGGSKSSALTGGSISPTSANPTNLTANDAIMLSETFREMMRKPSWTQNEANDAAHELDEQLNGPNNMSSIRLEEELALDGVGLHELDSKKNLTIIHDVKDDPLPSPSSV